MDTFRQASDVTLSSAIADFRYRRRHRPGSDAARLHWKVDLTPEPKLDAHAILNILRNLQEAINNVLRHARPGNLWIESPVFDLDDPPENQTFLTIYHRRVICQPEVP